LPPDLPTFDEVMAVRDNGSFVLIGDLFKVALDARRVLLTAGEFLGLDPRCLDESDEVWLPRVAECRFAQK